MNDILGRIQLLPIMFFPNQYKKYSFPRTDPINGNYCKHIFLLFIIGLIVFIPSCNEKDGVVRNIHIDSVPINSFSVNGKDYGGMGFVIKSLDSLKQEVGPILVFDKNVMVTDADKYGLSPAYFSVDSTGGYLVVRGQRLDFRDFKKCRGYVFLGDNGFSIGELDKDYTARDFEDKIILEQIVLKYTSDKK